MYRVLIEPEYAGELIGEETPRIRKQPRTVITASVILAIVACALAVWNFYFRVPSIDTISVDKMAYPLPEKPSIAVLPV